MPATAVVGAQWGDEAKGKIVHLLAREAQVCVRFNGGPNAGHTVSDAFGTARLHLVPSGALYPHCRGVIAHGVVVDPWALEGELGELKAQGRSQPRLFLSERCHLILPHHRVLEEEEGTAARLGTTRRGVGPAYTERTARQGLRLADLRHPGHVRERLEELARRVGGFDPHAVARELSRFWEGWSSSIGDAQGLIGDAMDRGEHVVFEGAQGTLLDLDFGTYPYVTSSTTTVHGVGWGTGLRVELDRVVGVTKAYTTRVGEGPFPTEDHGAVGEWLRRKGNEYGATTGRPRRCGWLDLVALRYAHRLNRFSELALTKLDVLSGLEEVKICTSYRVGGRRVEEFPATVEELAQAEPIYQTLRGWKEELARARSPEELPERTRAFLTWVENAVGVKIQWVSVGPGTDDVIVL